MSQRDYSTLPGHIRSSIMHYIENREFRGGDFVHAVITNNLSRAIGHADAENLRRLPDIVRWFFSRAPAVCWGSQKKMDAWLASRERDLTAAELAAPWEPRK